MAEEEQGFTFVDKRRTQAETTEAETPESAEPGLTQDVSADDLDQEVLGEDSLDAEDLVGEGAPDIYGLLGYCVSLLSAQAWQCLGLIADPKTGEAMIDLAQAKVAIDAVGDLAARLEAAPRETVPDSLRRDLRTLLNDLRLNFVSRQGQSSS